ncbi:MAG TPA: GAF domain-containing protein, partial [Candidatus Edwardsbacteria bacterium]|nr:GAF domain-containing protein [Candidatus Edwardsbacteria bacterium]
MAKRNPVKIALALAALLLALALAAGLLYRAPALDSDKGVNGLAVVSGFLLVAFYAWWASRNFRREQRRRWSLWQIALLTSLTGLAVQLSGGLSSFLLGFYLLPVWLAVFHAEPRWQLAPPLAAAAIELGSSYWGDRLFAEAVPAVFFAAMLALSFAAAKLFSRRALTSAAAPAATGGDTADEAAAAEVSLQQDLTALCALVQAAAGSRTCAVFRLEAMGARLRMVAFRSYSPNIAPDAAIDVQRGFLGWVVRERQGLLYPSYDKDFRALGYYAKDEAVGSVLAVPVRDGDAVRGMIVADSERDKAFDESGKLLLAGFAELAGRMMALHQSHSALGLEKERLAEWNRRLELMASRLTTAEVITAMKELVPTLVDCDHLCLLEVR